MLTKTRQLWRKRAQAARAVIARDLLTPGGGLRLGQAPPPASLSALEADTV